MFGGAKSQVRTVEGEEGFGEWMKVGQKAERQLVITDKGRVASLEVMDDVHPTGRPKAARGIILAWRLRSSSAPTFLSSTYEGR